MSEKIKQNHVERKAILYVRQSSAHQVQNNLESQKLQYAMQDRLHHLGWQEIEIVDEDLGRTASGAVTRAGFERMVAEVCLGHVGAVAAREVSRFARNSREWQKLVEVCRIVDTLLIDQEMAYLCRNILPGLLEYPWEDSGIRVSFDWVIFACTTVIILTTGVLFGLAPAWFAARTEVSRSLKESSQSTTRRRRGLTGRSLVGLQIALSTLLVVAAGLFLRTLTALDSQDVGFDIDHLILFEINPPAGRYPTEKNVALHEELERRVAGLPGVQHVSPATNAYLADSISNSDFLPEGEKFEKGNRQAEDFNEVGNDFFATLGIKIIAGRGFTSQDTATSSKVAVINRIPSGKPMVDGPGQSG